MPHNRWHRRDSTLTDRPSSSHLPSRAFPIKPVGLERGAANAYGISIGDRSPDFANRSCDPRASWCKDLRPGRRGAEVVVIPGLRSSSALGRAGIAPRARDSTATSGGDREEPGDGMMPRRLGRLHCEDRSIRPKPLEAGERGRVGSVAVILQLPPQGDHRSADTTETHEPRWRPGLQVSYAVVSPVKRGQGRRVERGSRLKWRPGLRESTRSV